MMNGAYSVKKYLTFFTRILKALLERLCEHNYALVVIQQYVEVKPHSTTFSIFPPQIQLHWTAYFSFILAVKYSNLSTRLCCDNTVVSFLLMRILRPHLTWEMVVVGANS